jgi:hypothetical protein
MILKRSLERESRFLRRMESFLRDGTFTKIMSQARDGG